MASKKNKVNPANPVKKSKQPVEKRRSLHLIWYFLAGGLLVMAGIAWWILQGRENLTNTGTLGNGNADTCKRQPNFMQSVNLGSAPALASSYENIKGMVVIDTQAPHDTTRRYQHPSWTIGGYLGSITRDSLGNVYVVPSPLVSLYENPPEKQNIVYKVDSDTAEMKAWVNLPSVSLPSTQNPYGALGLFFDCDTNILYASSVAGSSLEKESGTIFQINPMTGEVVGRLDNVDAIGVAVVNWQNQKTLVMGSARESLVLGVPLDEKGNFAGEIRVLTRLNFNDSSSLHRVRRISVDETGLVTLQVSVFAYNLMSPRNSERGAYTYQIWEQIWDWSFVNFSPPQGQ
jgi:hypothetical protein